MAFWPYALSYEGIQHQSPAVDKNIATKNLCTVAMCIESGASGSDSSSDNSGGKVWTKPGMSKKSAEHYQSVNGFKTSIGTYEESDLYYLQGVGGINEDPLGFDDTGTDATGTYTTACCLQRGTDGNECAFPLSKEQWYDTCKPYLCFMETCGSNEGRYSLDGIACKNDDGTDTNTDENMDKNNHDDTDVD